MKLNLLTTAALLAIVGTTMTPSAKAQFTANVGGAANSEDLILSFADNTSTDNGSTTNYEVDLGSADKYLIATSTINIANISSDLSSIYSSSSFFTNPNLSISILGDNEGVTDSSAGFNITNKSIFVSLSNPANPYSAQSNGTLNSDYTAADQIYKPNASGLNTPTDGAAAGSFLVPTANSASFFTINSTDGLNTQSSAAFTSAGVAPELYLETLVHGAGSKTTTLGSTDIDTTGYFTVTSGGEVQYVVASAAAPEPSTYALMVLGGARFFWHIRRKSVSSL